ncbi:MAG: hypothetical protein LPH21_09460 [Shewanella sp.]|nr:hypothetical protein [Shewanella sp.]MCF1429982.1 hypothetical protein [Shewanella sp.]MCF1457768.1 hypothetical protein [Shewanella sp.]
MFPHLHGQIFRITALFSMIFALVGFSYNVWRLEVTEQNATVRSAAFEVLKEMADLELIVYAAHYDKDTVVGNPRKGWVKVGIIQDLALLMPADVQQAATNIKRVWQNNWTDMREDNNAAMEIVTSLDAARAQIRLVVVSLQ